MEESGAAGHVPLWDHPDQPLVVPLQMGREPLRLAAAFASTEAPRPCWLCDHPVMWWASIHAVLALLYISGHRSIPPLLSGWRPPAILSLSLTGVPGVGKADRSASLLGDRPQHRLSARCDTAARFILARLTQAR